PTLSHQLHFLFSLYLPLRPSLSTPSLHDALPISTGRCGLGCLADSSIAARYNPLDTFTGLRHYVAARSVLTCRTSVRDHRSLSADRKSTRLNSSHVSISYAVFCFKKKNITTILTI